MTPFAYYNEIDPQTIEWLRELISEGLIPDGLVDDRSIVEVLPSDLLGFTQHHFFAGIGGWAYGLRLAGWPDDRPVWTGSCPCQPFSSAGKGAGFDDARHLWPAWERLIRECKPPVLFGEQVASKAGLKWLDLVYDELEASGYAVGAADLAAASLGAPHIRQRIYFGAGRVGEPDSAGRVTWRIATTGTGLGDTVDPAGGGIEGLEHAALDGRLKWWAESGERSAVSGRGESRLADSERPQPDARRTPVIPQEGSGAPGEWSPVELGRRSNLSGLGDPALDRHRPLDGEPRSRRGPEEQAGGPGVPESFWADAVYLPCLDGKWRPAQPGIFPLASGIPDRVALLRGAGNSVVPQVACAFIEAFQAAVVECDLS